MALTTEIPEFALFHMGGKPWDRRAEYELRSWNAEHDTRPKRRARRLDSPSE
jgi:hypothetical protein